MGDKLLLVLLCLVCATQPSCTRAPSGPLLESGDRKALEVQGAHLMFVLGSYVEAHGDWPATFAEAGLKEADIATKFGAWQMGSDRLDPEIPDHGMDVGSDSANGFRLHCDGSGQDWYLDP
ncbi:MAG TPA: hypothetical protein VK824_11595 [Planctomycetota bacterium]|nr:hypothetical protein [Planctomycetota bacterium]